LSIIGARPQFVKEAVIQHVINKHNDIEEIVVHTGQHYDENMSGIFFDVLNMKKPNYNLGIVSSRHGEMTGKMLIELERIMINENPDIVLLYGDTNSTLAGALAASKLKIKIAHVEAGLRQEPKDMPEETNRVLTDRISSFLFAPSLLAVDNLKKEGIDNNVFFTGDVMYDIFLKTKPHFDYSLMDELKLRENQFVIMTLHRDFNVDDAQCLSKILKDVNKIAKEVQVVFPIHPRTRKRIDEFKLNEYLSNVKVIDPIDYLKLMGTTEMCYKAVTDSGGYQKEAYFAGKQAVVVMPDTGWRELTDLRLNVLSEADMIYNNVMNSKMVPYVGSIYGEGNASEKIISILNKNI
jgi:UDP-N-acetylglucosamine 2-epimerase (non-hydrolysing)